MVQWLGFCTFTAEGEGLIPLRSYRPQIMVKKKKAEEKRRMDIGGDEQSLLEYT